MSEAAASAATPLLAAQFVPASSRSVFELIAPGFELVSHDAAPCEGLAFHTADIEAPFLAAEIEVGESGDVNTELVVGLGTADAAVMVVASWQPARGKLRLELVSGRKRITLAKTPVKASAGDVRLALALCENQATALIAEGTGPWRACLTHRDKIVKHIDFRESRVLESLGFWWGTRGGMAPQLSARGGIFGMTGLRDPHVVQHADGRPYLEDGYAYLTWTCAGFGFFPQAHWGVFRVDLAQPTNMELVAHLFARRDDKVLGDHAGQIVRDGHEWVVASSSWGDFAGKGVHVRGARTTADLLKGLHILDTTPVKLPTDVSSWDPALTKIDGKWHIAFVESPTQRPFTFHPALAITESVDPFAGLEPIGADHSRSQTEGPILAHDSHGWWLLTSDGDAREYVVYDLAMNVVGTLTAPYGTNIPHPQVLPCADGGWLMVTFDGTNDFHDAIGYGCHGDVHLLRALPGGPTAVDGDRRAGDK